MECYIYNVIFVCKFFNFNFFYFHVFQYDFECTNIVFFFSIHTTRSKKYIGIAKGYRRRVVRYVLSAKSHKFGYSILINNSVTIMHQWLTGLCLILFNAHLYTSCIILMYYVLNLNHLSRVVGVVSGPITFFFFFKFSTTL